MLKIVVPKRTASYYDPDTEMFVDVEDLNESDVTLCLEHSLYSLSKWESKWHKPFLREESLKDDGLIDYIRIMTVWPKNVPDEVYSRLTAENLKQVADYIADPMTATTFSNSRKESKASGSRRIITAEILYYSMISYGIPMECEKWHLNRLMALIHVFEIKNQDPKANRMSKSAMASQYSSLNAARRAKHQSRG